MRKYAIAYLDSAGHGFSILEPYVRDEFDSQNEADREKEIMIRNGFRQATIFCYEDEKLPEFITWNFVQSHLAEAALAASGKEV